MDFCDEQNNSDDTTIKTIDKTKTESENHKNDIEDFKPTKEQVSQSNDFVKAGDAEYEAKKYKEALEFYNAAVKINPKNQKALDKQLKTKNWVETLEKQGAFEQKGQGGEKQE